jgi:hypothetical protein
MTSATAPPVDLRRVALERHFTPSELGKLWHLSPRFVRELFQDVPGVMKIDRPERMHKRGYTTLRVPESVALRLHARLHH